MQILKDPAVYAAELRDIFGDDETALQKFNEARNSGNGWLPRMPACWCLAVAAALGANVGA